MVALIQVYGPCFKKAANNLRYKAISFQTNLLSMVKLSAVFTAGLLSKQK